MDIKNAQEQVDKWINEHGVRYFNELTNMAQLTEEVGEVARIIARRYGEQSEKESDKNKDLGEELADVLFVVLCLANQTGVNLQDAFDKIKTTIFWTNTLKISLLFFVFLIVVSLLINSFSDIFKFDMAAIEETNFADGLWKRFFLSKLIISILYGMWVTNRNMK